MERFARAVLWATIATGLFVAALPSARADTKPVEHLKVTLLSSMVVDYLGDNEGVGEWGFAALVEVDGRRILFDTGAHPGTVLTNARALGLELSDVTDVVLSHFHDDHTGGLLALRRELRRRNPHAMEHAHVGRGFFWARRDDGTPVKASERLAADYHRLGGTMIEHDGAEELAPGVWVVASVKRRTDEANYPQELEVQLPNGAWTRDNVPDDMTLVIVTKEGPVVITGCGHAGIINVLTAVSESVMNAPVDAVIGGLHLYRQSDARIDWTAAEMRRFGVRHVLAAHCTGLEAVARLRSGLGRDRPTVLQGAVGSSYSLEHGIDAGPEGLTR